MVEKLKAHFVLSGIYKKPSICQKITKNKINIFLNLISVVTVELKSFITFNNCARTKYIKRWNLNQLYGTHYFIIVQHRQVPYNMLINPTYYQDRNISFVL